MMEEYNEHPFGKPRQSRLPRSTGRSQYIRALEIGQFVEVPVRAENYYQKQRDMNNIRCLCSNIKRDFGAEFFVRAGATFETVFILRTK